MRVGDEAAQAQHPLRPALRLRRHALVERLRHQARGRAHACSSPSTATSTPRCSPRPATAQVPHNTRAMAYFVQTIRLLNAEPHQAADRDHAVPPPRAQRVPLRGLGRQAAVAASSYLVAGCRSTWTSRCSTACTSAPSAARRTGSTTARTSRGELAAAHPLLHRARAGVLQAAASRRRPTPSPSRARRRARARARPARSLVPAPGVHAGARGHERPGGLPRVTCRARSAGRPEPGAAPGAQAQAPIIFFT